MSDCVLLIKYTITYLLQNNESGYIKQIKEGINMKLAMGCDPAAYRFYKKLLERMKEEGYDIVDTGCESENEADGGKYAEIAEIVSNKVVSKECDYGILIEISPVLRDLITVIFCYLIFRKPLKTLNLSQVSFPLLFPLC